MAALTDTQTWRSYVEGPRWAHFEQALQNRVWVDPSLELVSLEHDAGLLRAVTRFEVRGPDKAVRSLQRDMLASIDGWNAT